MMSHLPETGNQIHYVSNFEALVSTPFDGAINAICWSRILTGDFEEIVNKVREEGNITVLDEEDLLALRLSDDGKLAREILLHDLTLLKAYGAAPVLNVIRCYDRDDEYPFFPTDVYSYHVDRSPVATDTFLCTYYGAASEILPNAQATQKVLIPELRDELKKLYSGPVAGFEAFLTEHFFDLHYQAAATAKPVGLGLGSMWRLAVDHPGSRVLPCVHRAPQEKAGQPRLLMIC
ncbi:MAG: DUF1826 domain-containing protein [Ferruginibacter sp.]